jgi:hypothetical protein
MNKEEKISRTPFPNSTKIYVSGEIHPIKVAMPKLAKTTRKCPMVVSRKSAHYYYDTRSLHRSKY